MALSLFGIILGLVLLMFLAYKGCSIIWVAPVCAVVVAVLGGYSLLDAYIGDYMAGMANYVLQWFPAPPGAWPMPLYGSSGPSSLLLPSWYPAC